jgi:hypothetical protein
MASATWHYSWWKKDMYDWALAGLVQICTWWNFKMSRRVVPFSSSQKCHKFMYDARYMTYFFMDGYLWHSTTLRMSCTNEFFVVCWFFACFLFTLICFVRGLPITLYLSAGVALFIKRGESLF